MRAVTLGQACLMRGIVNNLTLVDIFPLACTNRSRPNATVDRHEKQGKVEH